MNVHSNEYSCRDVSGFCLCYMYIYFIVPFGLIFISNLFFCFKFCLFFSCINISYLPHHQPYHNHNFFFNSFSICSFVVLWRMFYLMMPFNCILMLVLFSKMMERNKWPLIYIVLPLVYM